MKINSIPFNNTPKTNFKGWESEEVIDYADVDECPDDDRVCYSRQAVGSHTEYTWRPKYEDYFDKEMLKADVEKFGDTKAWKEHVKLECKERIKEVNKKENAPYPYFGIFGKYKGIIKTYLTNFEAEIANRQNTEKELD